MCSTLFSIGPEHVERYHSWMQDPDLLEATGSEPMTLEEELENQKSWRDDNAKCTFLVLARDRCLDINGRCGCNALQVGSDEMPIVDSGFVARNINAMVGDVNLFLSEEDDDEEIDPFAPPSTISSAAKQQQAEVDIMIADAAYRGKGLGREATILMMLYGAKNLGLRRFFCKINQDNHASRSLFENKLGFVEKEYVAVFKQYELELKRNTNEELVSYLSDLLGADLDTFACPVDEGTSSL